MAFKENLKSELNYSGLLVKELADLSGVNKRTIDNYLNSHNCIPSAEAAVRIAEVLGVTVEYLITGHQQHGQDDSPLLPDPQLVLKNIKELNNRDRTIVLNLINSLKKMEDSEKNYKTSKIIKKNI
jgi:transcriptional regulator with XRE-family HTH domain